MTTDINTAIAYLDATILSADDETYIYHAAETDSYWVVTQSDLEQLAKALSEDESDAYSLWCAGWYGHSEAREATEEEVAAIR